MISQKPLGAIALVGVLLCASLSEAADRPLRLVEPLAPTTLQRGKHTLNFTAPSRRGKWFLSVEATGRKARVRVRLNGKTLVKEQSCSGLSSLLIPISVKTANSLEVRITGRPPAQVTLRVQGVVPEQHLPPNAGVRVAKTRLLAKTLRITSGWRGHGWASRAWPVQTPTTEGLFLLKGEAKSASQGRRHWGQFFARANWNSRHVMSLKGKDEKLVGLNATQTNNVLSAFAKGRVGSSVRFRLVGYLIDQVAPTIGFLSPAAGAVVQTTTPIELTFADDQALADDSLQIFLNGQEVTSAFTITGGSATATIADLPQAALAQGANQLVARVRDRACNEGASSLSFVVGSGPQFVPLPSNLSAEQAGPSGTLVSFPLPTVVDPSDPNPTVVCTPASGSLFPAGVTLVTCTATNSSGNQATATFQVTVRDTRAPLLSASSDVVAEQTGPTGALVSYPTPTASDDVTASPTVTCIPPSGSLFPAGTTTVTCTATDAAGNSGVSTFQVTVQDTTPPTVAATADQTVEQSSPAGALVTYVAPVANDLVTASPSVTCSPASGTVFPAGTTTVTCTATDAAGNSGVSTFQVTVQDTVAPSLTPVADFAIEQTSPSGAILGYVAPVASDAVDPSPLVACAPPPGTAIPPGVTLVTCTATDAAGNSSAQSFQVTVQDTTAPTIGALPNLTVEQTSQLGAVVTFALPSVSDLVDPAPSVTCVPASGTTFPAGQTTVTCTTMDAAGNQATTTFVVTVQDTIAPQIAAASDLVVPATSSLGASVTFAPPTASDAVDPAPAVVCLPASGTLFPIGTTLVTCLATDSSGNSAGTSFTITVQPQTAVALSVELVPASTTVTAGTTRDLRIRAIDSVGQIATDFTGTVVITTSDGLAPLNGTQVAFTAADQGQRLLAGAALLRTAGNFQIDAETQTGPTLQGSVSVLITPAAPAALAAISGGGDRTLITGQVPPPIVAEVTDAFGNAISGVAVRLAVGTEQTINGSTDASGRATLSAAPLATAGPRTCVLSTPGLGLTSISFLWTVDAGTPPPGPSVVTLISGGVNATIDEGERAPILNVRVNSGSVAGTPKSGQVVTWTIRDDQGALLATRSGISVADGSVSIEGPRLTAVGTHDALITVSNPQGPGSTFQITVLPKQHVSGFVLDANRDPGPALQGVIVRVRGTALTATTDRAGGFRLESVPSGPQVLEFDGRTLGSYAQVSLAVVVSGTTTLGRPLFLPAFADPAVPVPLNAQNETTQVVSVPLASQPIARLEVAAGARVVFPGGAPAEITATQVELDEIVWSLPAGPTPSTAVLFGPANTQFPDGATLELPNDLGLAPGSPMQIYSADLSTGEFVLVGAAAVSPDGTRVQSSGPIVTHFSCFVAVPPPAVPPPPTTVIGRVLAEDNSPLVGANVSFLGVSTVTLADNVLTPGIDEAGTFVLSNVPSDGPQAQVSATITNVNGFPETGRSLPTSRVPGGTTDVGTFKIVAKTVVRGRLLINPSSPTPLAGARASVVGYESVSEADGSFAVVDIPSALQPVKVFGYRVQPNVPNSVALKAWKLSTILPPHDEIDVGDIVLEPVPSPFLTQQTPTRVFGRGAPLDRPTGSTTAIAAGVECAQCGRLFAVSGNTVRIWNTRPEDDFVPPDIVLGGTDPGDPKAVRRVAVDHSRLYISDEQRVLIYDDPATLVSGQDADLVLGQADFLGSQANRGGPATANTLFGPVGISSDGVRLVVTDGSNNRVLVWNSPPQTNGESADLVIGQPNFSSTTTNFEGVSARTLCASPQDALIDGQRLYVADRGNNRVLVYSPLPTTSTPIASIVLGQPDFVSDQERFPGLSLPFDLATNGQSLVVATREGPSIFSQLPSASTIAPDVQVTEFNINAVELSGSEFLISNNSFGRPSNGLRIYENLQSYVNGEAPKVDLFSHSRRTAYRVLPEEGLSLVPTPVYLQDLPGSGVACVDGSGDIYVWDALLHNNQPASRLIDSGRPQGQSGALPLTRSGGTVFRWKSASELSAYSAAGFDPSHPPLYELATPPSAAALSAGQTTLFLSGFDGGGAKIHVYRPIPPGSGDVPYTTLSGVTGQNPASSYTRIAGSDEKLAVLDVFNNRVLVYDNLQGLAPGSNPAPSTLLGQPSFASNPHGFGPSENMTSVFGARRVATDGSRLAVGTLHKVMIWEEFPTTPAEPADVILARDSEGPLAFSSEGLYYGPRQGRVGFAFYSSQPASSRPEVSALATPVAPQNMGVVPLTFTLKDLESDSVNVDLAYSIDGGVTFAPLTLAGGSPAPTGLTSTPNGTEHTLLWDARADIPGRALEVKLRVLPSDAGGLGTGNHTFEFVVDHSPLTVSEVYSDVAELAPGISRVEVLTFVTNRGLNPTQIDTSVLLFTNDLGADVSAHYTVVADPTNPTVVNPNQIAQLRFRVDVALSAPTEDVNVGARLTGTDTVNSFPRGPSTALSTATWRVVSNSVQAAIPEGPQLQAFLAQSGPQTYTIQVTPNTETVNLRIPRRASVSPGSPFLNVSDGQTIQLLGNVAGQTTLYVSKGTTTIASFPINVRGPANYTVTPAAVDFGIVPLTVPVTQEITVTSQTGTLTIDQIEIQPAGAFTLVGVPGLPTTVGEAGSSAITVRYDPVAGPSVAELVITTQDALDPITRVSLQGTGSMGGPTLLFTQPSESACTDGTGTVTLTYSDPDGVNTASLLVTLNGVDVTSTFTAGPTGATASLAALSPVEGTNQLQATVQDTLANPGITTRNFLVDQTAPALSVTPAEGAVLGSSSVPVDITWSDAGCGVNPSTLVVLVDGLDRTGAFTGTASGAQATLSLTPGSHTLSITVSDLAGQEASSATAFSVQPPPSNFRVLRSSPQHCATGVLLGTGFTIDLNDDLSASTLVGNVELRQGATVIPIQPLVYDSLARQIRVAPQANLSPQTTYTLVTLSGLESTSGEVLFLASIQFTTASTGPEADDDLDGLLNLEEAIYGTSPTLADTDGDGLSDFHELFVSFTSPTNPDTDGDNVSDGPLDPDGAGPIGVGPDTTPRGSSSDSTPAPAPLAQGAFEIRSLNPVNGSVCALDGKVVVAFTNPINPASVQADTNVILETRPAGTPVALTQATTPNPNAVVFFPTAGPLAPGDYQIRVITGLAGSELLDTAGTALAVGATHDFTAVAPTGGQPIEREFETVNYMSNLTPHWERFPLLAPTAGGRSGGAVVVPATGRLVLQETDVAVPGRGLSVAISRVYRNNEQAASGIFGNNWHFPYDCSFELVANTGGTAAPDWRFRSGDGRLFDYTSRASDPGDPANRLPFAPPPAFYDTLNVNGSFLVRRTVTGIKYFFEVRDSGGAPIAPGSATLGSRGTLVRIRDTQGNETLLNRHSGGAQAGLIDTIQDDVGRTTKLSYGTGAQDRLCVEVEQFQELLSTERRAWTYAYDPLGNLQSVTTPATVTSPAGKSRTYGYSAALTGGGQNLTQITDGNGFASFRVVYDGDDRVAQVDYGFGADSGTALYLYDFSATERTATQIDRNGHVSEVVNDVTTPGINYFLATESRIYTKGLHSGGGAPTGFAARGASAPEPPFYVTELVFDDDGELIAYIGADGQYYSCIRDDCGCVINLIRYCDKFSEEGTTPAVCDQLYSYVHNHEFKKNLVGVDPRGNDVSVVGGSIGQMEDIFAQTPRIMIGYDPELREGFTTRNYYQEENLGARLAAETAAALTPVTLDANLPRTFGRLSSLEVVLAEALGDPVPLFAQGEAIELTRIQGGFVGSHAGGCPYPHLHEEEFTGPNAGILIDGQGRFRDPAPANCGYGEVRPTASAYNDPPGSFFQDGDQDGFPDHGGRVIATRGPKPRVVEVPAASAPAGFGARSAHGGQQPVLGTTRQTIVSAFSYNSFGQLVLAQEPEGATNRVLWNTQAFSSSNPGAGMPLASIQATSYRPIDLDLTTGAPQGPPTGTGLELVTAFTYDAFGRTTSVASPRRDQTSGLNEFVTRLEYDALNMPTRVLASAPFNYARRMFYDGNNNLVQLEIDDVVANDLNENGIQDGATEQAFNGTFTHTYEYTSANRLLRSNVDATGPGGPQILSTTYTYDAKQLPVAVREPEGNVHVTRYDERDLVFESIAGFSDPATATTTRFDYDPLGRLVQVFDDDGANSGTAAVTIEYDTFNRTTRTTDEAGDTSEVFYDAANNPIRTVSREGGTTILAVSHVRYDEAGRPFQATSELFGAEHPLSSLTLGTTLTGVEPITPIVPTAELVDALVVYDPEGKPLLRCDENLHSTTTTYDLANRVVSATDQEGSTTNFVYDRASNVIRTETQEVVAGTGAPAGTYFSERFFDQLGRPFASVSHQMNATRVLYDSRSNVIQVSDAMGARGPAPVTLDGFPFAQEHRDATPLGDFPQRNHLSPSTDFLGGVTLRGNTTRMVYDGASRLLERIEDLRSGGVGTDAAGQSAAITGQIKVHSIYDRNSRLSFQVDPKNNMTSYLYDDQNRGIGIVLPDGKSSRFSFNRNGTLATKVDPRGVVETYAYDAKERVTACSVSNLPTGQGQRTFSQYTYDGLNRRTSAGDDDSETLTAFDSFSRPVRSTQRVGVGALRGAGQPLTSFVEGVLTRGFDGVGNLIRQVYPSGRQIDRRYDGNDRMASVTDLSATQTVATFVHAGHGGRRLERRQPVPDVTTTYSYDASRRVTGVSSVQVARSELITGFGYSYSPVGNRWHEEKLHESGQSDWYSYDSAYRLEQVDKDVAQASLPSGTNNQAVPASLPPAIPTQQTTFTLDDAGNRLQETLNGTVQNYFMQLGVPTSDSPLNQYTQIGSKTRSHDDAGNVISEGETQRFFDADSRLVQWKTDEKDVRYRYDADGRRTLKEDRGGGAGAFAPIVFFYDGWQCVEEVDASETLVKSYVHGVGIDEVLSADLPDVADLDGNAGTTRTTLWYQQNSIGSLSAVTDSNGFVVERYDYAAYGATAVSDGAGVPVAGNATRVAQPFGFTGRRLDYEEDSGLYYYRLRFYDPEAGRFLSRDPLGMWGDPGQRGNAQNYCGNNPVNRVDPLGLEFLGIDGLETPSWAGVKRGFSIIGEKLGVGAPAPEYGEWLGRDGATGPALSAPKNATTTEERVQTEAPAMSVEDHAPLAGFMAITVAGGAWQATMVFYPKAVMAGVVGYFGLTERTDDGQATDPRSADEKYEAELAASLLLPMIRKPPTGSGRPPRLPSKPPKTVKGATSNSRSRVGHPVDQDLVITVNDPYQGIDEVIQKYGMNMRGSGQEIVVVYNPRLPRPGRVDLYNPNVIEVGPRAFLSEEELARTLAHELNHARDAVRIPQGPCVEETAEAAENALGAYIHGDR